MDVPTKSSSLRANVERSERTAALPLGRFDSLRTLKVKHVYRKSIRPSRFHHLLLQCAYITLIRCCVRKIIPQQISSLYREHPTPFESFPPHPACSLDNLVGHKDHGWKRRLRLSCFPQTNNLLILGGGGGQSAFFGVRKEGDLAPNCFSIACPLQQPDIFMDFVSVFCKSDYLVLSSGMFSIHYDVA